MNRGRVTLACWACVLLGLAVLAHAALLEVLPANPSYPFGLGFDAEHSGFTRAREGSHSVTPISLRALAESSDSLEENGKCQGHSLADVGLAPSVATPSGEAGARATDGRRPGVLWLNHRLRC